MGLMVCPLLLIGCTNQEDESVVPSTESVAKIDTLGNDSSTIDADKNGMITLGEKFANPYSIENMQAAYNELAKTRAGGDDVNITVTDLYVRFLPKDSAEYRKLKEDLKLELFDYPLDHDILSEGTGYHDPSLPENQITWQYTTVKPDFRFPVGIKCEILDRCFIPRDEDTADDTDSTRAMGDNAKTNFLGELEYKALERVGYIKCLERKGLIQPGTRGLFSFLKGSKPDGYIKVYDNCFRKDVPVKGIKVRATSLIKWTTAYTDENGYYKMNHKHYWGPLYSVSFDNVKGFDIWGRTGPITGCAIYIMGFHNKKGYDRTFGESSTCWEWATINNAAYEYYSNCQTKNDYPTCPPTDNLKIWAWGGTGKGCTPMLHHANGLIGIDGHSSWTNFFANIFVGVPATFFHEVFYFGMPDVIIGTNSIKSERLYELVCHELSHASHYQVVGDDYWTKYVNYIITYGSYGDGTGNNSGVCGVGEMWGYAMGYIEEYEKYKGGVYGNIPHPVNNDGVVFDYWFTPDIIWGIYRDGILNKKQISDCMTSNVRSHEQLKQRMIDTYPTKKDKINYIFNKYGY